MDKGRLLTMLTLLLCSFVPSSTLSQTQESGGTPEASDWPREYVAKNGSRLLLFQPQLMAWEGWERLEARAAVAIQQPGDEGQVLGIVRLAAKTAVSTSERLVRVSDIELLESRFPEAPENRDGEDPQAILDTLFPAEQIISLDRILSELEKAGVKRDSSQLKADPPPIFVSTSPAILVLIDGEPILADIDKTKLQFVVNTNWDLFFDTKSSKYFLRKENSWMETTRLDGRWGAVDKLPKSFKKLPKNDPSFAETRAAVPSSFLAPSQVPRVFVSQVPAELIVIVGQPQLQPIGDTDLLWVTNTDNDLFVYQGSFYYLVAGRWFRAEDLDNEWTFATETLPLAFQQIPAEHPRARVLPSVPGTPDAEEAVILAQIPQTATVTRDQIQAPKVVYYGDEPKFEPIEGTPLERGTNTSFDVIRTEDRYYLCYEAVWFASDGPEGPWIVADTIPAEIYSIPASSPSHSVSYVQVYDSTPVSVTFGYTSGYWGVYHGWGGVVYGTGWYWPPYYYYPPYYGYPIYYPYPVTYGVSAWYNPNTGTYGRGAAVYGPYGGLGRGAAYNPKTGTYARGGAAYGPYNARGWAEAYNPTTGTYARTRQGADVYGNWGTTAVKRGDDWVRTVTASGDHGALAGYRTSEGGGGFVGRDDNNLYAGRDGNVYRRNESGWQKHDDGNWHTVERPDTGRESARTPSTGSLDRSSLDQLNRDAYGRQRGTANTDRYRNWNRGSGYGGRAAGGYGGARRGGSRRR